MFKNVVAAQEVLDAAQVQRTIKESRPMPITFGPWPRGESSERRAEQLAASELSASLNMVIVEDGVLRTRIGTTLNMTGMDGSVVAILDAKIGGTWYHFAVDSGADGSTYKLWFSNSGTATAIATLEGEARVVAFMGLLFIFDGGHPKMVSSMTHTSWVGGGTAYALNDLVVTGDVGYRCIIAHNSNASFAVDLAAGRWEAHWDDVLYDDGTGTTAYQWNNRDGSEDTTLDIDNVNSRIAQKFTVDTWTHDDKLPPTTCYVKLSKTLNPTGAAVNAVLRDVTTGSALATVALVADADDLTGAAVEYDATFSDVPRVNWMESGESYYLSIECSCTDAGNIVHVHCATVTAGGLAYHYTGGAYVADTTEDVIGAIKPGDTPHLVDAVVWEDRLYAIEGASGTNPSAIHYCNAGNHEDWSTAEGGGVFYCIDSSTTNFPVGGLVEFYDGLWVFGLEGQPFMGKLTGTPGSYSIENTLQKVSGHYKTLQATPDSAWHLHKAGIGSVRTIEQYGDVKAYAEALGWKSIISANYGATAFSGYEPNFGTYLVKLPGYDYILAVSTTVVAGVSRGQVRVPMSPVTRWQFAWASEEPTCFGSGQGIAYVGTDDGNTYTIDPEAYEDDDQAITYYARPNYPSTKFGEMEALKVSWNAMGKFGGAFNLKFYRNNSRTAFLTKAIVVPWDTSVDVTEITMDVADMGFLVDPDIYYDRNEPNFDFRSIMVSIEDIVLFGAPLIIKGFTVLARSTGGL